MKLYTSIKKIREYYANCFYCGYCDLQDIYRYEEALYYNSGVYGWNCDIYVDNKRDIAISTGYRNLRGTRIPDDLIKKYSDIAKSIIENNSHKSFDYIKQELYYNRERFLEALYRL